MYYEKWIYFDYDLVVLMILIIFKLLMKKMKNYKRLENIICFKKVMNIKKVISGFIL